MKPIDWEEYNGPPFFPEWMSKGETFDLIKFDDFHLVEIDEQIRLISDQFDLDNAKAMLLDRIGKIVSEPRDGNDDDLYRLLIRLRILLNTTNGSMNDVIKVVKFIFSSEVVHIEPNYPAGISILHDGESPSIDFNRIISQVVGAGIAYDTKELFYFLETMPFHDFQEKIIHKNDKEIFTDTVFRNGRVYRDGTTVLNTQLDYLFRDGKVRRNGTVIRNGTYWIPAVGRIIAPIFRRSGIQDFLSITQVHNFVDTPKSYLYRNGAVTRDGIIIRNGKTPYSANDTLVFDNVKAGLVDEDPISDFQEKKVGKLDVDTIGHNYVRNGSHFRNGSIYRDSEKIVDFLIINQTEPSIVDEPLAVIIRNGIVRRNGSYTRKMYADVSMIDSFVGGKRYHRFRNGQYVRNGNIVRNGMIFIPLD